MLLLTTESTISYCGISLVLDFILLNIKLLCNLYVHIFAVMEYISYHVLCLIAYYQYV